MNRDKLIAEETRELLKLVERQRTQEAVEMIDNIVSGEQLPDFLLESLEDLKQELQEISRTEQRRSAILKELTREAVMKKAEHQERKEQERQEADKRYSVLEKAEEVVRAAKAVKDETEKRILETIEGKAEQVLESQVGKKLSVTISPPTPEAEKPTGTFPVKKQKRYKIQGGNLVRINNKLTR